MLTTDVVLKIEKSGKGGTNQAILDLHEDTT
jgi:hypothetical protein